MKVSNDQVVSIEYELHLADGTLVDKSPPGETFEYLQGHGQIVPGLERELAGVAKGERKQVVVAPSDGYGARDVAGVRELPLTLFPEDIATKVGERVAATQPDGEIVQFEIKKIAGDKVTIDFNHPLAGETLHFDVHVVDVRPATAEELAHGHAHGPHGHGH